MAFLHFEPSCGKPELYFFKMGNLILALRWICVWEDIILSPILEIKKNLFVFHILVESFYPLRFLGSSEEKIENSKQTNKQF